MKNWKWIIIVFFLLACQKNKDTGYKNWKSIHLNDFELKIPPDYTLKSSSDTIQLIKNKDTIQINAQWMQTWEFIPKLMGDSIQNPIIKADSTFRFELANSVDSIQKSFPNYVVIGDTNQHLKYEIAYPKNLGCGFTEILISQLNNQETISIVGKNLSAQSIQNILKIYPTIQYKPKSEVYVIKSYEDECENNLSEAQSTELFLHSNKYKFPYQIESFKKSSQTVTLVKFKLYRNCCEEMAFKIIPEGKKLHIQLKRNSPIVGYSHYDTEIGILKEREMCLCLCLNCYQIELQGIENPKDYTFYYEGKPLKFLNQ